MPGLSFTSVGLFVFVLISQILAVALLPRTAAFTDAYWTAACLGTYLVSIWAMAYMIHAGLPISSLIPILAATVPLATIFVGVFLYHEAASMAKIVMLCFACGLIGLANWFK